MSALQLPRVVILEKSEMRTRLRPVSRCAPNRVQDPAVIAGLAAPG